MSQVPYQLIQQIDLDDLKSVLLAIDELHVIIPDTELYAPGLSAVLPHVDVYWHKLSSQLLTSANNIVSEQISQTVTTIFYHGTQEIVNKYHSDIDSKRKNKSIRLNYIAQVFEHKVTSEQKLLLKQTYENHIYPNYLFAMTMWQEPVRIGADT